MLTELLPWHSYDPDGRVFVQTDGSLGLAWTLAAPECDTLSETALGQLAKRLEALLALLPEGAAAQMILVSDRRVDLSAWLAASPPDGLLRDLAEARVRATGRFEVRHEGAVVAARSLQVLFTLRVFPRWSAPGVRDGLRFALRGGRSIEAKFLDAYADAKRDLLNRAEAVENLFAQSGIGARRQDLGEFRAIAFRMLNPDRPTPLPADDPERLVRDGIAFTHAEIGEAAVRLGALDHRVLTVREAPRETWAGMLPLEAALDGLYVLDIEVPRAEEVRKFLAAKKRLAFCQMSGGDDKVDVAAMKREVDEVSAEIFVEGARVYSARVHVVTRGAADAAINAFSRAGMELVAETAFAGTLLLQCLPLAYDPANDRALRRGRRMLGLNLAHLLPLYGALRGTPSPDLLLLNRRGEPVTFSFFDSPVAPHGIIAGVSGSGKSVLANAVILSAARRGARVFVLDRGNSYRKLCDTLGGTYVAFDPRAPRSINPCGTLLDEEKKIFLSDIVSEMGSQGQRELTVKERSLVARAVVRAFDRAGGREVLVGDIRRALAEDVEREARDLAVCLEVFCGDGPYAGFFDRPAEPEGDGCLTVYELGEIAKRRDVASVLLMALIHRITEYARDHLARQKYLIVDEAWTLLRSATTAGFLEDVLRTHRKLQSAAVMVTQQISDFEGRTGEAIRANAPNRLFLQQTPETVLAMEKLLDLSPEEKALLGKIRTVKGRFSEMLIQSTETRGVARLCPDPLSYWVSTSDPKDNLRLEALVREKGSLRAALAAAAGEA
ncbi:MAG TPA: TraC family protein [Planctomycetota bacterium]